MENCSFRNTKDEKILKLYRKVDRMDILLSSKDKTKLLLYLKNTGNVLKVHNEDDDTLIILKFHAIIPKVKVPLIFTYDINTEDLISCEPLSFRDYYNSEFYGF